MDKKERVARIFASLLLAAAAGCTTIDEHVRVADWPQLQIVEHRVPFNEMYDRCSKYTGLFMQPLGCTEFDFAAGRADIYVTPGFGMQTVLEHERLHAAGYDHVGSDHMERVWHAWLAGHPAAAIPAETGVAASSLLP